MKLTKGLNVDFYHVVNEEDLQTLIGIVSVSKYVALDTETIALHKEFGSRASALNPRTARIRLIQLCMGDHPYIVDVTKLDALPLIKALKNKSIIKIFHNKKYDLQLIYSTFGEWLYTHWEEGIHTKTDVICTMEMMKGIGVSAGFKSSQQRKHSYKSLCLQLWDIDIDKLQAVSDWASEPLTLEQLSYSALDVGSPKGGSLLLDSYNFMYEAITNPRSLKGWDMERAYWIDQTAADVLSKIEYSGMPVDSNIITELFKEAEVKKKDAQIRLCKLLNMPLESRLSFERGFPEKILVPSEDLARLLNSPTALVKYINNILKSGGNKPLDNLKAESLEALLDDMKEEVTSVIDEDIFFGIEVIDTLLEYKKLLKMTGTNYLALIDPVSGCLHSSFRTIGASTSRMASGGEDSFNAQQLSTVRISVDIEDPYQSDSIIL